MAVYGKLTPVFIVTGFLGSGKTTLLNHILRHPSLRDAAVLVNEFGDVGLDHFLVEKMDENTVLLDSGCLCCTIRDDLKQSIIELSTKRARGDVPPFKRMIIETTGLADPSPIMFTLSADMMIKHHYRLGTIITTVDAVNGARHLDKYPESLKQVTVADRLVITKTDIAEPARVAELRARLEQLNPTAEFITAVGGKVDVRRLLRADIYDARTKGTEVLRWLAEEKERDRHEAHGHAHDRNRHDAHIHSFTLTFDAPLDWTAFGIWLTMLLHTHGERVLRVKGMLNVKGVDAPVVINGVQHVVHPPMHLDAWPDEDKRSRIVFIVDDLERASIERSLAAFNRVGAAA